MAHSYLFRYAPDVGSAVQTISPEALDILSNYSWPGNIRELQNVMRGALIAATGTVLLPAFLPSDLLNEESNASDDALMPAKDDQAAWSSVPAQIDRWLTEGEHDIYRRALEEFDRFILGRVMRHTDDNQARAADRLGLSRITVRNKLRALAARDDAS